ncbi:MAG: hypothetical protein LBR74_07110 [Eubacterium sp.]|jgi:hypothetical protein|nr:hypothetical protein [Eubacterium sp.]
MSMVYTRDFISTLVSDYQKAQEIMVVDEPSVAFNISIHLTKVLILTCTSLYEQELQNIYIAYAERESNRYGDKPHNFDIGKRDKSIYQRFSFGRLENPNDNRQLPELKSLLEPLKFFGEKFRDKIYNEVNADINKEREVKAFQEMFAIRNLIAHQTFIGFNSDGIRGKSFMDIKRLHDDAIKFVDYLISYFT